MHTSSVVFPAAWKSDARVLVVGAGPVGLTAACFLERQGIPFDIVDVRHGPVQESRALGVHARTLEFMSMLGLDGRFVAEGLATRYMSFHRSKRHLFSLDFSRLGSLTDYPFYLILPQARTEAILAGHLSERQIRILWGTRLEELEEVEDRVRVALIRDNQAIYREYSFVVGADGASSKVRSLLGIPFEGATYPVEFLLGEVEVQGNKIHRDATHVYLGATSTVAVIPQPNGLYRFVGPNFGASTDGVTRPKAVEFDEFRNFLSRNKLFEGLEMRRPSRLVSYKMHKRVAQRFNKGRTFLAGDAAHVHSPAGGQGMNTGMHDAINLVWKLSQVISGRAHKGLLDTYEGERRAFARSVVAATDVAMAKVMSRSLGSRIAFDYLAPLVVALRQPVDLIAAMAQIASGYPSSFDELQLDDNQPEFKAGKRVPSLRIAPNLTSNRILGRNTLTLFLNGSPEETSSIERLCRDVDPAGSRFEVHRVMQRAGKPPRRRRVGGTGLLCRPDGYVLASFSERATATASDRSKAALADLVAFRVQAQA